MVQELINLEHVFRDNTSWNYYHISHGANELHKYIISLYEKFY